MRAVKLTREAVRYLGSPREWGTSRWAYVGKCSWSKDRMQIECFVGLTADRKQVRIERRDLVIVDRRSEEWVPKSWRRAAVRYCRQWPNSAEGVAYFADLSEEKRRERVLVLLSRWADHLTEWDDWAVSDLRMAFRDEVAAWSGGYRRD